MYFRRIERLAVGLGMRLRSEQRETERVAPHIDAAERNADDGAELRPQRFDVADPVQILADRRITPGILILDQLIVGAAGAERGNNVFGREQAAANSIMHALDAWHI